MWRRQEQPAAVPGQRPERGLERLVMGLLMLWLLVEIELELEPAQGW